MFQSQVLVVSNDTAICDSLRALLPVILKAAIVEFSSSLTDSSAVLNRFTPDVIVIDTAIGQNTTNGIIAEVELRQAAVRIVLLADAPTWQDWKLHPSGNLVLLKGFSIRQLAAAIHPGEEDG